MAKRKILADSHGDRLAAYRDNDLVPDSVVKELFSITRMTIYRWERDPRMSFPAAHKFCRMNYRKAGELRRFRDSGAVTRPAAQDQA
jgi:hypothetical protein